LHWKTNKQTQQNKEETKGATEGGRWELEFLLIASSSFKNNFFQFEHILIKHYYYYYNVIDVMM